MQIQDGLAQPLEDGRQACPSAGADAVAIAFDHARVGLAVFDPSGQPLRFNEAYAQLMGCPKQELVGTNRAAILPLEDDDRLRLRAEMLQGRGSSFYRRIARGVHTDGRVLWADLSCRLVRDAAGEPLYFVEQVQEVTDREGLDARVREVEQRFRALVDNLSKNVPGTIFEMRRAPDGRITVPFASERIRDMFHLTAGEAAGDASSMLDRVHRRDQLRVAEAYRASRSDGSPINVEYRVVLPGRGTRHYLTRADARLMDDGTCIWHGCTMDVTEMKLAQLQLQSLNGKLEERVAARTHELERVNRALEAFTSSVSHDLRSPLTSVGIFAQYICERLDKGEIEQVRVAAKKIHANAQRMHAMIDGFLDLARARRPALTAEPMDMGVLVRQLVSELPAEERERVHVGPLPRMKCDAAIMRQVFWNLIANGLKYSAGKTQPRVEVSCSQTGESVTFCVSDNGIGFDPAHADKLFHPFARLHRDSEYPGTGVGLAIVRNVVEACGGRVWAQGRPGEGAAFSFSLPT